MAEKQQQQREEEPIHQIHHVPCSECRRFPINGWAYRCGHCRTTLCQACIMFTRHNADHVFLLLKRPMDARYAMRDQLLPITPYTWSAEPQNPPVLGLAMSSGVPTFSFPANTWAYSNTSNDAPLLEHKKGPLFDRASELARFPSTQPPFSMDQPRPSLSRNDNTVTLDSGRVAHVRLDPFGGA